MDMKNFSRKHLHKHMRHLVAAVIEDESNLFPDTLFRMYILNAPLPFRLAWKIVANFIHPITVEKIQILGPDYLKYITKDIDINQIPPRYNGKGKWKINFGRVADIEDEFINQFHSNNIVKQVLFNKKKNTNNNNNNNSITNTIKNTETDENKSTSNISNNTSTTTNTNESETKSEENSSSNGKLNSNTNSNKNSIDSDESKTNDSSVKVTG